MKVMLDTNILISAFVFKSSTMNKLINKIISNHNLYLSSYCVDELKDLIKTKFKINYKELEKFLNSFPFEIVGSSETISNNLFNT